MTTAAAVRRTAGVLGHELRNPLAAAVAGTALLAEMVDADDPRRAVVDGVASELRRIAGLIDSYLALARCGRPRREPVAVAHIVAAVASRRLGVATDSLTGIAGGLVVAGDAVLLERALENLVENALAAGARRVHVSAVRDGDDVVLAVADDGPGVAPELRQRIFEPGFSRCGSTGLGLDIVAEVAAAHGGSVACVPGGSGARFLLRLPAAAVAATGAGAQA